MDPITATIDKAEEIIGHSPHPAIVALPIGAWSVSNVCDGLYIITGNEAFDDTARISMAVGLVGAAAAAVTGLRDYGFIPKDRQPSHEVATTHALGNAVASSLFVASYVLRARDRAAGHRSGFAPRLLALAGGALSMYTAWLGGKLVQEYGEAVKPVMERQKSEEKAEDAGQSKESPQALEAAAKDPRRQPPSDGSRGRSQQNTSRRRR